MKVASFEGIVENGRVKLPDDVHIPEQTKVYVEIRDLEQSRPIRIMSPRLVHPEQAEELRKTIIVDAKV